VSVSVSVGSWGHADVGGDGCCLGIQKAASKTVTDGQPASGGKRER